MPRYIDADELRGRVKAKTNPYGKPTLEYESGVKVLKMIDEQPAADVVEVVRCKDCEYRYVPCRCALWYASCNGNEYFAERGDEFYCSYGKRKG